MKCIETEKLSQFLDGELDAEEAKTATGHIDTCNNCKTIISHLEYVSQNIRNISIDEQPHGQCPDVELIQHYACRELSQAECSNVEEHISLCNKCLNILSVIFAPTSEIYEKNSQGVDRDLVYKAKVLISTSIKPIQPYRFSRQYLKPLLTAAAVLAIIAGSIILYLSNGEAPSLTPGGNEIQENLFQTVALTPQYNVGDRQEVTLKYSSRNIHQTQGITQTFTNTITEKYSEKVESSIEGLPMDVSRQYILAEGPNRFLQMNKLSVNRAFPGYSEVSWENSKPLWNKADSGYSPISIDENFAFILPQTSVKVGESWQIKGLAIPALFERFIGRDINYVDYTATAKLDKVTKNSDGAFASISLNINFDATKHNQDDRYIINGEINGDVVFDTQRNKVVEVILNTQNLQIGDFQTKETNTISFQMNIAIRPIKRK